MSGQGMSGAPLPDATQLLEELGCGGRSAVEGLLPLVYTDMRRMA